MTLRADQSAALKEKVRNVYKMIASGEQVAKACKLGGINYKTYYNLRNRRPEYFTDLPPIPEKKPALVTSETIAVKPKRTYQKRALAPIVIPAAMPTSKIAVAFGSPDDIANLIRTMGV